MERSERSSVVLRAHAKLTLSLRITGTRTDGYHLIDAEMVSLDLHDMITITAGGTGISADGPFAAGVPLDRSNLVARALDLVGPSDAHVALNKLIPHGGGLGGGSTDAATVMRWAGLRTSDAELVRASKLGADIPFCLVGGRARVTGIGEVVEPLPFVEQTFTLVVAPLTVSTPAVYQAWDTLGGLSADGLSADGLSADGLNDLEAAALSVEPELHQWRTAIGDRLGVAPTLAGSGATWFAEGEHQDALADLIDKGATVMVARTVPSEVAAPTE